MFTLVHVLLEVIYLRIFFFIYFESCDLFLIKVRMFPKNTKQPVQKGPELCLMSAQSPMKGQKGHTIINYLRCRRLGPMNHRPGTNRLFKYSQGMLLCSSYTHRLWSLGSWLVSCVVCAVKFEQHNSIFIISIVISSSLDWDKMR